MADTKISGLTALVGTAVDVSADLYAIVDTSVTTTKKITVQEAYNSISGLTALAGTSVTAASDSVPIYQSSTGTAKRILVSELGSVSGGTTLATPQASTSGTAIDFTSIPAGTKRITVMFNGVSTNGISNLLVQIGDSGGIETSGYTSSAVHLNASGGQNISSSSAGFILSSVIESSDAQYGQMILSLENASNNTWVAAGQISQLSGTPRINIGQGAKATSSTLDRVRITTVNGTDTFDAGEINIQYSN